ncbi:MAG: menaquinone biosynthesis protein [Thermincola sp.]|jgi:chorismate dehydratase|nr:menaquinone biosynthesis protein [Thermincola sp.]MDT3703973.1 menaquinone biosynthesis protein [Thermincola sp.]
MNKIRLGQVDYLNCYPVYYAIEHKQVPVHAKMVKGYPTKLNEMFLEGKLDITPISSIEFARNSDKAIILPNMSISADGDVQSILLFSKVPVTELDGLNVCLTSSSATSVALLKILFEHYYQIQVRYTVQKPDLQQMLKKNDAALLIGDDALLARHSDLDYEGRPLFVIDLGRAWRDFTGQKMIYALWVIRSRFVEEHSAEIEAISKAFVDAKNFGFSHVSLLVDKAEQATGLPRPVLESYFQTIQYEFGEDEQKALLTYYDYAYKSGLINERVKLNIWGETIG